MRWLLVMFLVACGHHGAMTIGDDDVAGDDAPPGDAATGDATGDATTCVGGEACVPEEACHGGLTSCEGDRVVCHATDPVADGTACGGGDVCDHGACVAPCDVGLDRCSGTCVDLQVSEDHCGDCTTACDVASTCDAGTCKPGAPLAATGACTLIDQPGWLSCPTGMSCQCYYNYFKVFIDQPAHLDTWLEDASLQVTGGTLPSNPVRSSPPPATVALVATANGKAGSSYPYTVTVSLTNEIEIKLRDSNGYVPAKSVLYTSSDCGNRGKILECTFH